MKRISTHLTEQQIVRLGDWAKYTGLPVSELIRRAIDDYIKGLINEYHERHNMESSKGLGKKAR